MARSAWLWLGSSPYGHGREPTLPGARPGPRAACARDRCGMTTTTRSHIVIRVGLGLAAALAVMDIASTVPQFADEPVVPTIGMLLGLATLVAVPFAWRGARWGRIVAATSRVLASLIGLPAFFVPGIPAEWVAMAAAGILLSVLAAVLILAGARR